MKDKKIRKWETLKSEILSAIPSEYIIDVEDLEREDNKYFHPYIKINDDIVIKGQCDIDTDRIYGWGLETKQYTGGLIYTVSLNIESFDQVIRVLTNWDKYKDKLIHYIEISKLINENIEMLKSIKSNIEYKLLNDVFDEEDKKECLDKLFKVKEWIENERIIEKYSK